MSRRSAGQDRRDIAAPSARGRRMTKAVPIRRIPNRRRRPHCSRPPPHCFRSLTLSTHALVAAAAAKPGRTCVATYLANARPSSCHPTAPLWRPACPGAASGRAQLHPAATCRRRAAWCGAGGGVRACVRACVRAPYVLLLVEPRLQVGDGPLQLRRFLRAGRVGVGELAQPRLQQARPDAYTRSARALATVKPALCTAYKGSAMSSPGINATALKATQRTCEASACLELSDRAIALDGSNAKLFVLPLRLLERRCGRLHSDAAATSGCDRAGRASSTSAPGLGSPHPHLCRDWGAPLPRLHRDWAH